MESKFSKEWIESIFRMHGKCENKRTKEILLEQGFNKTFKIINIVGTNGKGSVTKYLNDALIAEGYKVGKFTSPHLFRYNERITINNKEISDDEFFKLVNPWIETYNKEEIMWFPLSYIAAMKHFQNEQVDFAVIEAGIGGIEDPSSVIDGDWGLVTSIGEDHMEWFKTRDNISYDKAGVTNEGMRFFLPSALEQSDKEIFREVIKKNKAICIDVDNEDLDYQIRNQKIANAVFEDITGKKINKYETPFGRTTIKKVNGVTAIYDVGHNEPGIKAVLEKLAKDNIRFDQVVISLSKNKDDSTLSKLFNVPIYIYEHKGHSPKKIEDFKVKGIVINDIKEFHKNLEKDTLFIGSFFLIDDLLNDKK